MIEQIKTLRSEIGARVRKLRQERRWSQTRLAALLGISQNYLSLLERGRGSFTAEQLLTILKHFNVPIDYFSPIKNSTEVGGQIQNALAREGAGHLIERTDIIPSEQLKDAADAIRETLLSADSARQITALAPVLAAHARNLNLPKLKAQLAEAGVDRRLPWAAENTKEALDRELRRGELPRQLAVAYERARLVLQDAFLPWALANMGKANDFPDDILDPDIASEKSKEEVRRESSEISRRWRILSRIQVEDFVQALRAAND
ncbi:MAG: helix-turn-helix transcriptional regulator [Elusimicrobia bacterium]|nr:helix-turn-helix transcriptional regulator [Elusimicrobiota bacterium]